MRQLARYQFNCRKVPPIQPLPLILLPGLDGTGVLFKPLLAALPPTLHPVVVTFPGDRHLTYHQLLPLVRDAFPRGQRFILLGESFSGPLAAMVAAERPAGLVGMILCATFLTPPWRAVGPLVPLLVRSAPFRLFPALQRLRARLEGYSDGELFKLFQEMHRLVKPHVIAARVRMVFRTDARDALRSSAVPLLYLQATRDRVVPARHAHAIRQLNPNMQLATFTTSHLLLQTRSAQAAEAIQAFANSLPAAD